jgi:hypothetical protein
MKRVAVILGLLLILLLCGCEATDPWTEPVYGTDIHAQNYYDVNGNLLIPSQTGNNGLVLGTNGISTLWVTGGGGSNTILNGAGAPGAGTGADGDFYIDTTANEIYGPKAGGAWGVGTSLIGPQGIQGLQGIQGVQGPAGAAGPNTVTAATSTNLTGILVGNGANVGVITNNSANWDAAYGWGNHASAGYLTSVTAHNLLSATHGDTTVTSAVLGEIIYANSTPAWTALAGDTSNTRKFLRTLSVAGVAQAPAWDTVTKTDVGLGSVENTALSTWAGTSNIITVGTITTGTWSGSTITPAKGGTGVANGTNNTITFTGNYTLGLTLSNNTSVTLPTTGTLLTVAGGETITGKVSYNGLVITANTGAITTGTWNATAITGQYGGTGVANTGKTITLGGNLTTSGAFATTLTVTAATNVTLPTTGTLSTLAGTETFTNKTLTTPIVQISLTAGENIVAYQVCYVKSDGKVYLAKANSATTMPAIFIAQAAVNINNAGNFMAEGYITNAGWAFTPGQSLFVSEATAGLVTNTAPSSSTNQIQVVGIAITATQIKWYPSPIVLELQ